MSSDERGGPEIQGALEKKKKFLNGWTREQEQLMATWADIGMCYRWLHSRSERHYKNSNFTITIPVIILSTLTGTASVGIGSVFGSDITSQKYAQLAIGGVSIITGILSTLGNYLRFAQLQEGNRVAAMAWGKLNRLISAELALHPHRRCDCQEFLKICRTELDHLIESVPELHSSAVSEFNSRFGSMKGIALPDEAERLRHTEIFEDDNLRLKQLALDAALVIRSKKELLKDMEFTEKEISMFDKIEKRLKTNHEDEFGDYVIDTDSITESVGDSKKTSVSSDKKLARIATGLMSKLGIDARSKQNLKESDTVIPVKESQKVEPMSKIASSQKISQVQTPKSDNEIVDPSHDRLYDKF